MLTGVLAVWLCFAGAAWGGEYIVNPNGTVADTLTGLMWQREDDSSVRNWEEALVYCEDLTLDVFADWRLPNMKELESLTDKGVANPAIDSAAFPNTALAYYWSATTFVGGTDKAWAVSFGPGVVYTVPKSGGYHARCVRGGL